METLVSTNIRIYSNMRLVKLFIAVLTMIGSCASAGAQLVKFSIGIEGGGLGTYMKTDPKLSPGFGYGGYGGAAIEIRIGRVAGLFADGIYAYQTGTHAFTSANGTQERNTFCLTRQYIHIPFGAQLWMGRAAVFQIGLQQSILLSQSYVSGNGDNSDEGISRNYLSLVAGFKFNMGRVAYFNIKGTYGLNPSYTAMGKDATVFTASLGLGFRLYTYRKSAFR